jgi:hypothetical protein
MTKTVHVSGLQATLDKLQPYLKAIASGTVQLAEGVVLNIPDQSDLSFTAISDDVIRCTFSGVTADISLRAFFGMIPIHGREPATFADVGPSSVSTKIAMFNVVAVDAGGG